MAAITIQNPIGGPGCTGDGVSNELLLAIAGPAIVISDDLPPRGVIGDPYSFNLMAIGGTPPFDFTVVSGSLPPGLTLSSGGAVIRSANRRRNLYLDRSCIRCPGANRRSRILDSGRTGPYRAGRHCGSAPAADV